MENQEQAAQGKFAAVFLVPMPRFYRCAILAAFGWLVLSAQSSTVPNEVINRQEQSSERVTPKPRGSQPLPARVQSRNDTDRADPGCPDRKERRRDSDLCAQWKAADAAADQVHIGWFGLALGVITMAAAIAAAKFARDAAIHTKRGADATMLALVEQHRARLSVKPLYANQLELKGTEIRIGLVCEIENKGEIPAYFIGFIFDILPLKGARWMDPDTKESSMLFGAFGDNDLQPKDTTLRGFTGRADARQTLGDASGIKFAANLIGCVSYLSGPSQDPRRTYFAWTVEEIAGPDKPITELIRDDWQGKLEPTRLSVSAQDFGYREE